MGHFILRNDDTMIEGITGERAMEIIRIPRIMLDIARTHKMHNKTIGIVPPWVPFMRGTSVL